MSRYVLAAYGLRFGSDLALPGAAPSDGDFDVTISLAAESSDLEAAWSGPSGAVAHRWVDERPLDYHRGVEGDTLLRWAADGSWLLDAPRAHVLAHSPADPPEPGWLRVLLDSVLASVALGRGAEALHAGAVATPTGAIAILGRSGAGKTSLLAALLARGHALVTDDVLVIVDGEAGLAAHQGPPVMSISGAAVPGRPLAQLGDETWVQVPRVPAGPVALRALVLLDRRADAAGPAALEPETEPFAALFGHVLGSGDDVDRARDRFALLARLAEHVPVLRLVAPLTGAPPDQLARLVEAV